MIIDVYRDNLQSETRLMSGKLEDIAEYFFADSTVKCINILRADIVNNTIPLRLYRASEEYIKINELTENIRLEYILINGKEYFQTEMRNEYKIKKESVTFVTGFFD